MRLEAIRKQRGMSQEKLANQLSVKQNTVSQWENGRRNPRVPMLVKIAEILGCSVNDLVGVQCEKIERLDTFTGAGGSEGMRIGHGTHENCRREAESGERRS